MPPGTAKREYDQFYATETSSVNKARLLQERVDLEYQALALLGDDDLVSITLGLLGQKFKEIVVFDIDVQLLDTINLLAKDLSLPNITTVHYDARKEIPSMYRHYFDAVVTDPPYTKVGAALFLSRAIELARKPSNAVDILGVHIFFYFGSSLKEPNKKLKIQEIVLNNGLFIQDKIQNFVSYYGAESIGSSSDVYILGVSKATQARHNYTAPEIYTYEKEFENKFPYVDHVVVKLFDVSTRLASSKKQLQKIIGQFCSWHKLKVVDHKLTRFKGGGLTLTFVLAQSNLVVHTWPERNAVHIDLITCEPIKKKNQIAQNLSELFSTDLIELNIVE